MNIKNFFQTNKMNYTKKDVSVNVAHNQTIMVFGVNFHGVEEIKECALKGIPKKGVYVGEDSQHYPCFDSSDYAYENRYYWNFVFAKSKEELEIKMKHLREMENKGNYKKLSEELAPMLYWQGDPYYPMEFVY